ncbi:WHG domain-containing protein [Baekduia soli]|uniref:WHG domain-containing protein n=1 Tax=Baekduia soli TaxID=496014 RepID=A0A5B8U6U8_9ACTN|nr:WHG domain-containing protein [Baekduia soli]QEC48661.1 WHG domain-containing protein [Baekduia soli]
MAEAIRAAGPGADARFAAPMGLVAAGQVAGEIVAGDPERIARVAWAAVHGLAAMADNGLLRDAPLDAIVDEAVQRLRPR